MLFGGGNILPIDNIPDPSIKPPATANEICLKGKLRMLCGFMLRNHEEFKKRILRYSRSKCFSARKVYSNTIKNIPVANIHIIILATKFYSGNSEKKYTSTCCHNTNGEPDYHFCMAQQFDFQMVSCFQFGNLIVISFFIVNFVSGIRPVFFYRYCDSHRYGGIGGSSDISIYYGSEYSVFAVIPLA